MIQEYAKIRLIDAMDKSVKKISKMLDDNAPDEKLKQELDLFAEMEKSAKKHHIPYTIKQR
jgi:hypothetical protein